MSAGKRRRFVYLDTSSWNKLFDLTQARPELHQKLCARLAKKRSVLYSSDEVGEELVLGLDWNPIRIAGICTLVNRLCGSHVIRPVRELVADEFASRGRGSVRPRFLRPARSARKVWQKLELIAKQPADARAQIRAVVDQARAEKKNWKSSAEADHKELRKSLKRFRKPRDFAHLLSLFFGKVVHRECFYPNFERRMRLIRPEFSLDVQVPIRTSPSLCHSVRFFLWLAWVAVYGNRKVDLGDRADHNHFVYACHANWFVTDDSRLQEAWTEAGTSSTTVMGVRTFLNRVAGGTP